jgi:GT2 family glycosyltransferase
LTSAPKAAAVDLDEVTGSTLSVLVVSYNSEDVLRTCLASLAAERESRPFEVIVVDNASQDQTVNMVAVEFPWVRVIANATNAGYARAVNQALAIATGDIFLLLNPDTRIPQGTLGSAVATLLRYEDVGMLGCKLVRADGSFDHACKRNFPSLSSALYYLFGVSRAFPRSKRFAGYTAGDHSPEQGGFVDAINGAFMLVKRTAVNDVGPMDERFWLYAEDLDWCLRFWQSGWKILYWPWAEVVHLKGASAGQPRSAKLSVAFYRSAWLYYRKHHRRAKIDWRTVPVFIAIFLRLCIALLGSVYRVLRQFGNSMGRQR